MSSPYPWFPRGMGLGPGEVGPRGELVRLLSSAFPDSPPPRAALRAGVALGERVPDAAKEARTNSSGDRRPALPPGGVGPAGSVLTADGRRGSDGLRTANCGPLRCAAGRASVSCAVPAAGASSALRPAPPWPPPVGGAGAGPRSGTPSREPRAEVGGVCRAPRPQLSGGTSPAARGALLGRPPQEADPQSLGLGPLLRAQGLGPGRLELSLGPECDCPARARK